MKFTFPKFKKIAKTNVSVGLDIGGSYIKLVTLREDNNQIFLDDFCSQYVSGEIPSVLGRMTKACNLPTNKVNISLSGKSTIVRDLWMPQMSQKELKVSLGYELDQYVPFPAEDIYYDSFILSENPLTRKEGQMRVVLAVANKKFVNERIQWLKASGFVPNYIDMDAITLFNLYEAEVDGNPTVGLVDIGSNKTIIDIVSGNELTFTREVEYGTIKVKDGISRGLSVSAEEAEKLICAGDPKITVWLEDLISKLSRELWNSFEFYEGQEQRQIEKVYITGGGSLFPGLAALLGQSLGLPVVLWHPIDKIKVNLDDKRKQEFEKTAPMYSIAIGLAYKFLI